MSSSSLHLQSSVADFSQSRGIVPGGFYSPARSTNFSTNLTGNIQQYTLPAQGTPEPLPVEGSSASHENTAHLSQKRSRLRRVIQFLRGRKFRRRQRSHSGLQQDTAEEFDSAGPQSAHFRSDQGTWWGMPPSSSHTNARRRFETSRRTAGLCTTISSEPDCSSVESLWFTGSGFISQGKFGQAVKMFSEALQLPECDSSHSAILYSSRCSAYQKLGQHQLALKDAAMLLRSPDNRNLALAKLSDSLEALGYLHASLLLRVLTWREGGDGSAVSMLMCSIHKACNSSNVSGDMERSCAAVVSSVASGQGKSSSSSIHPCECSNCRFPLIDPVLNDACGHAMCQACRRSSGKCSFCGALFSRSDDQEVSVALRNSVNVCIPVMKRVSAVWNSSQKQIEEGHHEQAIQELSAAIILMPHPLLLLNRSVAYSDVGNHEDALHDAKQLFQACPQWLPAILRVAECLQDQDLPWAVQLLVLGSRMAQSEGCGMLGSAATTAPNMLARCVHQVVSAREGNTLPPEFAFDGFTLPELNIEIASLQEILNSHKLELDACKDLVYIAAVEPSFPTERGRNNPSNTCRLWMPLASGPWQVENCAICISRLSQPVSTPCGHTFCQQCLHRSLDRKEICPCCRACLASWFKACTDRFVSGKAKISSFGFPRSRSLGQMLQIAESDSNTHLADGKLSSVGVGAALPVVRLGVVFPGVSFSLRIDNPNDKAICRKAISHFGGLCCVVPVEKEAQRSEIRIGTIVKMNQMVLSGRGNYTIMCFGIKTIRIRESFDMPSDPFIPLGRVDSGTQNLNDGVGESNPAHPSDPEDTIQCVNMVLSLCKSICSAQRMQRLERVWGAMPVEPCAALHWWILAFKVPQDEQLKMLKSSLKQRASMLNSLLRSVGA